MDDRFYHSFLPPTAKVCGRKLETFSLWHHLVLSAIGSPIALGGDSISVADLLIAVRVCRLKYGDTDLSAGLVDAIWNRKLTKDKARFRKDAEVFYEWMALQSSPPKFYRSGATGGMVRGVESGPRCLGLVCSLMNRGGLSEDDAWNCSLGRAMWMDAQFAQLNGVDLRFLDDDDLDDSEINISDMTDDEAMAKFQRDLPEELVGSTFDDWLLNIKGKGGDQ